MFFDGLASTRERVLADLSLNIFRFVAEEDGAVRIRAAHLCLESLEGWEERRVEACRLLVLEPRRSIPRHPEVRVLVDGAGDEGAHVFAVTEDVRECVAESRYRLNRRIGVFSNIIRVVEPEYSLYLVQSYQLLHTNHVSVHMLHVLSIHKDKRLLSIKSKCYYFSDILLGHFLSLFESLFRSVEELLVISDLDDYRNIEDSLQVLSEYERDSMSHMKRSCRRSSSRVEVEGRAFLICI
mmetsp:Transcript_39060/g.28879  ORF Transcript_39060/g.28879 Transcript_39060/m.28879 type:complete len:239 (-) Transcript_39060:253-969(-)